MKTNDAYEAEYFRLMGKDCLSRKEFNTLRDYHISYTPVLGKVKSVNSLALKSLMNHKGITLSQKAELAHHIDWEQMNNLSRTMKLWPSIDGSLIKEPAPS